MTFIKSIKVLLRRWNGLWYRLGAFYVGCFALVMMLAAVCLVLSRPPFLYQVGTLWRSLCLDIIHPVVNIYFLHAKWQRLATFLCKILFCLVRKIIDYGQWQCWTKIWAPDDRLETATCMADNICNAYLFLLSTISHVMTLVQVRSDIKTHFTACSIKTLT